MIHFFNVNDDGDVEHVESQELDLDEVDEEDDEEAVEDEDLWCNECGERIDRYGRCGCDY